jgi:hypothetical protein
MASRRLMLLAIFAPGLASAAPAAPAQSDHDKPAAASEPSAAASAPSSVEGVTVNAPRAGSGVDAVPPEKAAAFAEEAAKNEAWRKYRESTPPLTSDPNDLSKDFPGLQAYVPK